MGTKLSKAVEDFPSVGLELHESATGRGDREALGTVLSCDSFHSRLTTKCFWNLRRALSAILRHRRGSGAMLEVLIGHMSFAALANRWSLSVSNAVYKSCREHYVEAAPMWHEVRTELYVFGGIMLYLQSE